MPAFPRKTALCHYRYDPLDRLVDCAPAAQAAIQRFYCKSRLASEIQGAVRRSVFQHDDALLAQLQREDGNVGTSLLATDQQRSVLNVLDTTGPHPLVYAPYGHHPSANGLLSLLGFNGEPPDPVTGHYLLGNGYRAFNPVLMRFNSPDTLSPFGEGGVNAYGYCGGDSINRNDPTGHFWGLGTRFRVWGLMSRKDIDVSNAAHMAFRGAPVIYKKTNINPKSNKLFKNKSVQLSGLVPEQVIDIARAVNQESIYRAESLINTMPADYRTQIKHIISPTRREELLSATSKSDAIKYLKDNLEIAKNLQLLPSRVANDTWNRIPPAPPRNPSKLKFKKENPIENIRH
ncbi:RHS repeat-associated core domain-containing protein [Pseudomonas citrulli]|uniref:RHS repeat-associated core domain-containing protein n=1 Tax=Pseudomonas citrulli TaxID=3064347 RepID=A0ABT9BVB6_9PSED|nr:RHS repeat-associated core domain-containing protein [Pseudomonas sp. K18]MDO7896447.1 RHS repeat-associated core domain-containing protein [Pseudomonas sp. K18]